MTALAFNNPRVQQLRRLIGRRSSRHDDGRFVVEGPVLVAEARGRRMDSSRHSSSRSRRDADIAGAGEVFELAAGVFERVASTEAPQPPIAIVRDARPTPSTRALTDASFVVVLDRIGDPGNLGTIIRSAEAAGVDAVVLTPGRSIRTARRSSARRPARCSTSRWCRRRSTTWPQLGCSLVGTSSHDAPARTVVSHTRRRSHRARRARDGQRGRRPARRLERLRRSDPAVDHDSAPRTQRVAECGDGRDGARCSKPPGNEIRRARTAGTDRSPAGMRTRRRAGPSARHRRRSRRDPADTAR